MRKRIIARALSLAALGFSLQAEADERLVRFEGGIGVIPTGSANNTVRGVPPAGQIWVISRLSADVRTDGRISVDGRGLLLGGGNNIGTTNNQSVRARLFCGAVGNGTPFDSALVPLEANGDFRIEGEISDPNTGLPSVCERPVLLILNPAGSWFAAGIPKL